MICPFSHDTILLQTLFIRRNRINMKKQLALSNGEDNDCQEIFVKKCPHVV